jgi:hypothetical protein
MSLEILARTSGDDDRPILRTNVPRLPSFLSCCAWLVIRKLTDGDSADRYCTPEMIVKNFVDALDNVSTSRNWRSARMMMRRIRSERSSNPLQWSKSRIGDCPQFEITDEWSLLCQTCRSGPPCVQRLVCTYERFTDGSQ